jgi:hypothetical protein
MCRSLQYSHDSSSFSVENISDSLLQSEVGRLTSSLKQLISDGAGADANFKSVEDVQESIDTFENLCTRIACERQRLSLLSRALRTSRRVSVDVKNELTSLCVCCDQALMRCRRQAAELTQAKAAWMEWTVLLCAHARECLTAIHRTTSTPYTS